MLKKLILISFILYSLPIWSDVGIFELQNDEIYYNSLTISSDHKTQLVDTDTVVFENLSTLISGDSYVLSLFNPTVFTSFNSGTPSGINDGAIWQGVGFNSQVETGLVFQSEYIDIKIIPKIWWTQNSDFETVDSATDYEYGSIIYGMDQYQRPGDDSYYDIDLGKTSVELKYNIFSLEFSNDSFTLGPARISPIIMSDNSAGFKHIRLGFDGLETPIGVLEFNSLTGYLEESDFFDNDTDTDKTIFLGYNFAYSPSFLKNFTFGFNRTMLVPDEYIDAETILSMYDLGISGFFFGSGYGYDSADQRASFTFDWSFPEVGLKIYAEWAKNDYSTDYELFFRTPEHADAITLGLSKVLGQFLLEFEFSDLMNSEDYELGDLGTNGSFYMHGIVTQGYTNLGQLLGAGIGSGSDAQTLSLSYFKDTMVFKGYLQRVAYMKDYIYGGWYDEDDEYADDYYAVSRLQYYLKIGLKVMKSFNSFSISGEASFDRVFAYNFEPETYKNNIYCAVSLQYKF